MMVLTGYIGGDGRILVALLVQRILRHGRKQTEFGLTSLFDSSNDRKDSKKDEGQDYYFTSQSSCADHLL